MYWQNGFRKLIYIIKTGVNHENGVFSSELFYRIHLHTFTNNFCDQISFGSVSPTIILLRISNNLYTPAHRTTICRTRLITTRSILLCTILVQPTTKSSQRRDWNFPKFRSKQKPYVNDKSFNSVRNFSTWMKLNTIMN